MPWAAIATQGEAFSIRIGDRSRERHTEALAGLLGGWARSGLAHVDEAAVVALEGDGDGRGRSVAVLADDEVGFAGAG